MASHRQRREKAIRDLLARARARLPGVLVVAAMACGDPMNPGVDVGVHGSAEYDPPSIYLDWWKELEECSGTQGDFERVRWFSADSLNVDGDDALGLWVAPHDIYLIRTTMRTNWVVKHEMLHDLLRLKGRAHRSPLFERCVPVGRS